MLTDTHIHTSNFSIDASSSFDDYLDYAIKNNIKILSFTDHYDDDSNSSSLDLFLPLHKKTFIEWKDKSNKLNGPDILRGIEIGYRDSLLSDIKNIGLDRTFDVIIMSNHKYGNTDVYFNKEMYNDPLEKRISSYLNVMSSIAESDIEFDIMAHFDYVNRYNPDLSELITYDICPEAFDRLFKAIIDRNATLEINTKSIWTLKKRGVSNYMTDPKILRRYMELGGKNISLGSDSHQIDTLNLMFDEVALYLKKLGFTSVCYYKERNLIREEI